MPHLVIDQPSSKDVIFAQGRGNASTLAIWASRNAFKQSLEQQGFINEYAQS
jgi:hypothetical protein